MTLECLQKLLNMAAKLGVNIPWESDSDTLVIILMDALLIKLESIDSKIVEFEKNKSI